MLSVQCPVRITWGQCDPAGIVFYPRYFEIFDNCTAALMERGLGMNKFEALKVFDFGGFPLVATRARFLIPNRFGDDVVVHSTLKEFRRSSFDIEHRLLKNGVLSVEGFETRVWVASDPTDPSKIKSKPIPQQVIDHFKVLQGAPA